MQIHDLKPAAGSNHRRKVVGRGIGSGHGKTSTRGHNGNKARGQVNPQFEGGQTPLHRRLPHIPGFKAVNKKHFALVNVGELEDLAAGTEVSPEFLMERGVFTSLRDGLKILGDGQLTKKLTVKAHKFSKGAVRKLEAAGGAAEVIKVTKRSG